MGFLCQGVTQELKILYTSTAAGEKPGQLLKKLAQATPEVLLHRFVPTLANFPTYYFT